MRDFSLKTATNNYKVTRIIVLFVDFGEKSPRWANIADHLQALPYLCRKLTPARDGFMQIWNIYDHFYSTQIVRWTVTDSQHEEGWENNLLFVQSFWLSFYKSEYPGGHLRRWFLAGVSNLKIAYDNSSVYTMYRCFYKSNFRPIITQWFPFLLRKVKTSCQKRGILLAKWYHIQQFDMLKSLFYLNTKTNPIGFFLSWYYRVIIKTVSFQFPHFFRFRYKRETPNWKHLKLSIISLRIQRPTIK